MNKFATRIFAPFELIPPQWGGFGGSGSSRVFNPAILASTPGYIMAYRVVLRDGCRRLAVCRLDPNLAVVPGSHIPLSDLLSLPPGLDYPPQAKSWFADPRLIVWDNRLLVHWNSGCHEPANHQFVQELHPRHLTPVGASSELVRPEKRTRFEKNRGLFASGDALYCVYSIAPLCILRLVGASGRYYFIHHSSCQAHGGSRYVAGGFAFSAKPPFAPEAFTERPLQLANPFGTEFLHERLNATVAEVIYPCGAICEDGRWLVSYGINDEHCAIAAFEHGDLIGQMRPAECSWRWEWFGAVRRMRLPHT